MAELFAIDPRQLDMFWGAVLPFVERAMETSAYDTPQSVHDAIAEERAVLWIVWTDGRIDAVCITQLETTPKAKFCGIWVMTGTGRENWQDMIAEIEDFARREGCTMMRHNARPGWSRVLKTYGYACTHHIVEKAL